MFWTEERLERMIKTFNSKFPRIKQIALLEDFKFEWWGDLGERQLDLINKRIQELENSLAESH